ncbi:MAG: isoleucine--tRNA ligase [Erysipelotrichaceae bacterium]
MEYKDTLLMPKTDFEMKGNLTQKEPAMAKQWNKDETYNKFVSVRADRETFVLHDGPPYANGNLHAGTAMNRVIKDFIVKSKAMLGYQATFFPGWDTHGLPIENAIQKLGHNRKELSTSEFRDLCEKYAYQQIQTQKETMRRLGTLADYANPYITLKKEYEARQIRSFAKMAQSGLIYQGLKPVYWSYASESACADSEIIYLDKKDPTIFVSFDVLNGKGIIDGAKFVIWTTTPWTIPANLAICLHPRLTYALVNCEKGKLIMVESLVDKLLEKFEIKDFEIVKTFKGEELAGCTTKHPFYDRESLIILGDHVTDEDGTGCVHTAPGHGTEDFFAASKYGLPAFCPVDEKGCMTAEAGKFLEGLHVDEANKVVTQKLDELGALLKLEFITHSYPHDERMKKPVIYRATIQWFASIDKIRNELLANVTKVKWINQWGEARLYSMIKERGDWCISRQRVWGLPIPIIYNEDGSPIIDADVFEHIASLVEKHGSNIWFDSDVKDLLPKGYTNKLSPNNNFAKEKDIMDVWFDSGSSFNELIARNCKYPADLYFEGPDQYRGWFNSSLIVASATTGIAPFKSVLSHGYVNDDKGFKMSKSVGNVVNPLDIVNKYGADIFRLWAGSIDFKQDMRIGDDMIKQIAQNYRKIRNYFRFMLGNINHKDFNYQTDLLSYDKLTKIDQYVLIKLDEINAKVQKEYDNYNFLEVSASLFTFMTNTISAFYLDFAKDILYIDKKDSLRRRQVQSVIYQAVDTLVRLWAPILSFTTEELWTHFVVNNNETIFVEDFKAVLGLEDQELIKDFERFNLLKDDVLKALELAREDKLIGKPLEAKVRMNCSEEDKKLLEKLFNDKIHQVLIVSAFEFTNEQLTQYDNSQIEISKAVGSVCPRCWNISESKHQDHLCARCADVLK